MNHFRVMALELSKINNKLYFIFVQWIIIKLSDNVCWYNLSATFNNQPDLMKHRNYGPYLAEIAQINIVHCVFNIFQWIIIQLDGNVCWLNPLAKFNNQPDPIKFSGVMALELTRILNIST